MGEVVSKNNLLQTPVTEKIIGVRHSNGIDAWLLAHEFNSNSFIAYHVTSTGISAAPVVSSVGPIHGPGDALAQGQMKASANGTKLALGVYGGHRFELYDFNPATGEVTNPEVISGETNAYGVEFSPNGQFLYTSNLNFNSVNQFDLLAGNNQSIIASKVTVGSATTPPSVNPYKVASLQIGPDQKIYVSKWESTYLAVIQSPDMGGLLSNFVGDGIYLGGKHSFGGFPNPVLGYAVPTSAPKPIEVALTIFPNPAREEVRIILPDSNDGQTGADILVRDMLGRSVFDGKTSISEQTLKVTDWSKGVYIVQVNQSGKLYTSRLVVE